MHSLSHSGTVNGAVASLSSESKGVTVLPNVVSGLVGLTEFAEPGQVLFSPMTLNSIEQTILGLGQNSAFNNHAVLLPKDNVINKSTSKLELITKRTDTDDGDFSEDDSTTNDEWEPGSKIIRKFDGSMEYAAASPNYSSTDSNGPIGSASTKKTSNRPTGPRKPRKDIQLTPEEEERRNMRRERNKQAAAKCRQKRVDLTNQLQSETEALEAEQKRLQDEIKTFQREKEELEYILASHRLHCGTNSISGINTSSAVGPAISVPLPAASTGVSLISSAVHMTSAITSAQNLSSQELKVEAGDIRPVVALSAINNKTVVNRPNSFPTSSLRTVSMVNMTNGTNVLSFGLESMLDGHTGLTPITGMPSCAIATAGQQLPTMTPGDAIENGHLGGLTAL